MNVIQMLNIWRWLTKESAEPLLGESVVFPTWFWSDERSSGWSFIGNIKARARQAMMGSFDCYLFALSRKSNFPVYFILDRNEVTISDLEQNFTIEQTPRTWLTREENKNLYGIDS